MKKEDAEEFTQSLGQIVGGSWRQIALAKRLGVPQALGLGVDEWVNKRLGGYIKMTIEDRRKAAGELATEGDSSRAIGEVLGVDHVTVLNDLRDGENSPDETRPASEISDLGGSGGENSPLDAVAALAASDKTKATARATETRKENEEKRKADLQRPVNVELPIGVHHGDFYELSRDIPDASVELVFTDPPYDADSIDLYGKAAEVAARILKPGGSFVAYSGQRHLPQVLEACGKHLEYWWVIAGVHAGGKQIMQKLGIRCGWKPLVWFVKGTRGDVQHVLFDVVTGAREKESHEWQQAESEAAYYIEHLTSPDGIVVDFFLGGGTTKAAADKLGRKCIAYDKSANAAESAAKRLTKKTA